MKHGTFYRTIQVDGLSIFYREAGPKDAPAPDYPGFGHTDWPDPKTFAYTFDHIAETINHFIEALGLSRYTLYMQDYGGPVGFRMALAHQDRIEALIVQDAVAHNEGLGRIGNRGGPSGPIALPTRVRFGQICCRWRLRGYAMRERSQCRTL